MNRMRMSRSAKRYRVRDTGSGSLISCGEGEIVARAGMGGGDKEAGDGAGSVSAPEEKKVGWRISHGIALSGTGSILRKPFPFLARK